MQTQTAATPKQRTKSDEPQLSPRVAAAVQRELEHAEERVRKAIEARSRAEAELERCKVALAGAPDDSLLIGNRRQARATLDDAVDVHEVAIAAREATIKRIDDAHDDLVELSRRERDLEGVNDPSFQQWSESVNQRLDAAFAEICAVIKEAKTKSQEQGLARAGAAGLASAIGLTTYTAPQIEHDRRMGVLRRAAHAAIERAGLHWHGDVKDLIVGY